MPSLPNDPHNTSGEPNRDKAAWRTPVTGANNAFAGPTASFVEVEHLSALIQRLSTLLEGSRENLERLKGSLSGERVLEMAGSGEVEKRLVSAAEALERMSELVHNAMQGPAIPIGSATMHRSRPVNLGEAVEHAVELLAPMAKARGVDIHKDLAPGVASLPSGPLYTVVLNALQNAIEAVSRRGVRGRVDVTVKNDRAPSVGGYGRDTRDWYVLEVSDDGCGVPHGRDGKRVFDLGFTTKPRGAGVGLAVAKNVVQGMGGTIELVGREGVRGGAVLRVKFPGAGMAGSMRLGGAA